MALRPWKKLSETRVCDNPYWEYRRDQFELPSGKCGTYHYVHTHGAVMIVPVAADGRIHLVKQYRYLIAGESIEFPCGGVRAGDSFEHTAHAELAEEAGLCADSWTEIGSFVPCNGICDETCRVYVARELRPTQATPDETEEFEQMLLGPPEIDRLIAQGALCDGMTLAAWAIVRSRL
jgi:8-oxo-dGTP pyrophosphatase MutT (NUDIX family)